MYTKDLWLTNIGNDSTRIKLVKSDEFNVDYKVGPIAPGMRKKLQVTIRPNQSGAIKGAIKIVGEREILEVSCSAVVELV